ncbi:PapB/FocB family fimbrial expression transcriptional regulator [Escherichia coli]|uniref:PapB/FocB family fimbrial expression transcriptional regulator n=1 Tax=Escherichia coli TaxID=562 RepID=UPI0038B3C6D0
MECLVTACNDKTLPSDTSMIYAKKKMLIAGSLTDEWFNLLIDISTINSEKTIKALREHLVNGVSRKDVCKRHGVNAGYFSICMGRLFYINQIVGQLASYYLSDE